MNHLLATIVIWGIGIGMNMGLYSLIIIEYMGLDLYPKAFGAECFAVGILSLIIGPSLGKYNVSVDCFICNLVL